MIRIALGALLSFAMVAGGASAADAAGRSPLPDRTVQLDGRLIEASIDHLDRARGPESAFAVLTDEGALVQLDDAPSPDSASGDRFEGTVTVSGATVATFDAAIRRTLGARSAGSTLDGGSAVGQAVLDQLVDRDAEVSVAQSRIVESAAVREAATLPVHQVQVAVVAPAGSADTGYYTDAQVNSLIAASGSYWVGESFGDLSSFSRTGSILRYTSAFPCGANPFSHWNEASQQFGYGAGSSFLAAENARHIAVILPASCAASAGIGVGTVGFGPDDNGFTRVVIGQQVDRSTQTHELGHNLGLGHANADLCSATAGEGCVNAEYADFWDIMGFGIGGFETPTALNASEASVLGFRGGDPQLDLAAGVATTTTAFTLSTLASKSGVGAVHVIDPSTGDDLYVEYRAGEPAAYYSLGGSEQLDAAGRRIQLGAGVRLTRLDPITWDSDVIAIAPTGSMTHRAAARGGESVRTVNSSVVVNVSTANASTATISITLTDAPAPTTPIYRFWSPVFAAHFYTADPDERDFVIDNYPTVWNYERVAYQAFSTRVPGSVPLYRFWSPRFRGHFFTADPVEAQFVIDNYPSPTWEFEGVAFYVYPDDYSGSDPTTSVFRFWSPRFTHHFFTADPDERDFVAANYPTVWSYEGSRFRVPTS